MLDVPQNHRLAHWLQWQAAHWPRPLVTLGALEDGWQTVDALTREEPALDRLLVAQAMGRSGIDRRTLAAYLIARHSYCVAFAFGPAYLHGGILADVSDRSMAIRLTPDSFEADGRRIEYTAVSLRFLKSGVLSDDPVLESRDGVMQVDDRAALRRMACQRLEAHFSPLIDAIGEMTGLPAAAQWRLVSDSVAAVFLDIGQRADAVDAACTEATAILKQPGSPLANPQMHFFDLDVPGSPGNASVKRRYRSRGGCCRYYKTDGGSLCATCVLQKPEARDELLRAQAASS
ncbi:ferric iron reductase [Pararhizobium haloflavum]|uniref:ferric iron reductase n=1 Tax=Pararhizobium haloflavum TaxID=2037914 RepID=UPI000C18E8B1|nr:ferric iron reductase [Pararhizobium haloflavum]